MMTRYRCVAGALSVAVLLAVALNAAEPETALLEAVKAGDVRAARVLLAKKPDVNAAERDGTTVLHWAIEHDDAELVASLITAGARVNVANRYGTTLLHVAATYLTLVGGLQRPHQVTLELPAGWTRAMSGLPELAGRPLTFVAADYDALVDGPIVAGDLAVHEFAVRGKPH